MNKTLLIWRTLMRHKGRTTFTWLAVVMAFILFSLLAAARYGTLGQLNVAVAQRLDTYSEVSKGAPLPLAYYNKIIKVPGVISVTYLRAFTGFYKNSNNTFQVMLASPTVFHVFPEATVPPEQLKAWLMDRQGVIVGPDLANRMGWRIGDTIPVQSLVPQKDGSTTWYFHLLGIYRANLPTVYQGFFVAHYQYFNEGVAVPQMQNDVNQYIERIDDARNINRISNAIDNLFSDASPQTFTQSEQQEATSFIRQFGNISIMVIYVGVAVFFSLLLIIGNTFAQSVRERTSEFALLRVLGYKSDWIVLFVVQEAVMLIVSGGILGLILGGALTHAVAAYVNPILPTFGLTWRAFGIGILLSLVVIPLITLVPLPRILSLQVAKALNKKM